MNEPSFTYRARTYTGSVELHAEPLDAHGYTRQGRYFGVGARLYRVDFANDLASEYIRAADRRAAIASIRAEIPGATIARG